MEKITKEAFVEMGKDGVYFCGVIENRTLWQLNDHTRGIEARSYHVATKFLPCVPDDHRAHEIYKNNGFVMVCDRIDGPYYDGCIYATLEPQSRIIDGDERNPANWQTQCRECFEWFADDELDDGVCFDCEGLIDKIRGQMG
ncbi:MAG: hypothetical protein K9M57_10035 [Phycisphaerae bacterium]|nr:hypothetical protein [Phycisphaerae bacterium]